MYGNENAGTAIGGGRLGAAATPTPDESAAQIRDAIGGCEEYLMHVHDLIGAVERRLETVLTPEPPQVKNEANTKAPMSVSSHVRGRINNLNEGLREALRRLESIRQRVEV